MRRQRTDMVRVCAGRQQVRCAGKETRDAHPARRVLPQGGTPVLMIVFALFCCGCGSESQVASPGADASAENVPGSAETASTETASASDEAITASTEAATASTDSAPANPAAEKKASAKPPAEPTPAQQAKWNINNEPPLQLLACYDGFGDSLVQCMAVAPGGKQFVLGGTQLTLWNVNESQPTVDLVADYKPDEVERPILAVGISPDGEWLVAGDLKGTLRFWTMSDQKEVNDIQAHSGRLTQLAFSPDSNMLATTSYAGEVALWQVSDGKTVNTLKVDDQEISRIAFLSDSLLACAGRETTIWNVDSGEKVETLTTDRVIAPALGISTDRRWLLFADAESQIHFWDVEKNAATELQLRGAAPEWIEFSNDDKRVAAYAGDDTIRIWDAATRNTLQVIDADGGRVVALKWLPQTRSLAVASQNGRVRIWGTAEAAAALGVAPLAQPVLSSIDETAKRSLSSAQFRQVIDVRSFPRLPDAVPGWSYGGMDAYSAPASQEEAELFYRHTLGAAGWTEITGDDPFQPGLNFHKEGCRLNVSFSPASSPAPGREADLQISLRFAGNYDVRWLPKISPVDSKSTYSSFSTAAYRTKAEMTDVEIAILKQFHEAGWTGYTRLAASSAEDPRSRSISMLQGGSELTVSIGYPADADDELFVQTSVNVTNKSLPLPADSGWIEFDSSTDLQLVANTKMDLKQTIEFFDAQMPLEGWLAREAGRHIEDERAFLPYIRGQKDVLIRLVALPGGGTRAIVGDAETSSFQLKQPAVVDAETEEIGIEAADFKLPKGATAVGFDVDEKRIQYELPNVSPAKVAEMFVEQMEDLEWQKDGAGVMSDDYVFLTYTKGKAEIQMRGRAEEKKSTVMISGDGLLWSKPLPTAAVRISYDTWLRRQGKTATLDHLDEFAEEMHKIPASAGKKNELQ
ncbi:MAG: hypothetical protein WD065_17540 [Planctomycetaceae bacterium]